jgi:transcriptional regulator with XRE-family HTH domain
MMDASSGIMESAAMDAQARLAARVRGLRVARGLTLDGLAARAGVSRSMLSLVERGEASPTAAVLDRIAAGLGVTIASLFGDDARAGASPLSRRSEQESWRDPETGYVRRNLSPAGHHSPIELVEVRLPPHARVAYDGGITRAVGISQQVWLLEGRLELTVGEARHLLDVGDCLAMRLDRPITFRNPAEYTARYLVALAADVAGPRHP